MLVSVDIEGGIVVSVNAVFPIVKIKSFDYIPSDING